jgi:hypothetical protein
LEYAAGEDNMVVRKDETEGSHHQADTWLTLINSFLDINAAAARPRRGLCEDVAKTCGMLVGSRYDKSLYIRVFALQPLEPSDGCFALHKLMADGSIGFNVYLDFGVY